MSGSKRSSLQSAPRSSESKTGRERARVHRGALQLRAEDAEDLSIVSACLQDALVPIRDIAYFDDERMFVLVANRYRREPGSGDGRSRERTLSGLCFEYVSRVQRKGFAAAAVNGFLNLLSVALVERGEPGVEIELVFSGGAAVRLTADRLRLRLDDIGESWPTQWAPEHGE